MNQAYTEMLSPSERGKDVEEKAGSGTLPLLTKSLPAKPPLGKQKKRVNSHGPKVVKARGVHRSASIHADMRIADGECAEEVVADPPRTPPCEVSHSPKFSWMPSHGAENGRIPNHTPETGRVS